MQELELENGQSQIRKENEMYQIDQLIVYKKDVCRVKELKKYNDMDYYILIPVKDSSLKISIPTTSKDLRTIISKEEIEKVMKKMPEIEIIKTEDKMIEHIYRNLLSSGTYEDLIKIIKTAYLRNEERVENNKKISEKDKEYFDKAEEYLYTEFSYALNKSYEETKDYIIKEVKKLEDKIS